MTTSVGTSLGYSVTVNGGSFIYGVAPVTDTATGKTLCYPSHFTLSAATGAPVEPMTEQTGLAIVAAVQALTAALTGTVGINAGSA